MNNSLRGYASPSGISDHYLVGLFTMPSKSLGPKQWHFPVDMLGNTNFDLQVYLILDNFDKKNAKESWEIIKLKIQSLSQKSTCFCQRQAKRELKSLHVALNHINKWIFEGDNLDLDRLQLEQRIEQCMDMHAFFLWDDQAGWVCLEGKPNKKFLHLEDVKRNDPLDCLKTKDGIECHDMENILEILCDFYSNLYSSEDQ